MGTRGSRRTGEVVVPAIVPQSLIDESYLGRSMMLF